jgi:hypothetical protein
VRTHVARLASQIDVQAAGQNHTGLHAAIVQEPAEVVKDCPYDGMDSRCQRTVKPPSAASAGQERRDRGDLGGVVDIGLGHAELGGVSQAPAP